MKIAQLLLLIVVTSGPWFGTPGFAQPPGEKPTPRHPEKLKERDRLSQESSTFEKAGKFAEAIEAAEKMLAIERTLFEEDHEDILGSFITLGLLHERKLAFTAAENFSTNFAKSLNPTRWLPMNWSSPLA